MENALAVRSLVEKVNWTSAPARAFPPILQILKNHIMLSLVARQSRRSIVSSVRQSFSTSATENPLFNVAPVNILKDGTDPVVGPLSDYPEWVQTVHLPKKGYGPLQRIEERTFEEECRFLKLVNRRRIKTKNSTD